MNSGVAATREPIVWSPGWVLVAWLWLIAAPAALLPGAVQADPAPRLQPAGGIALGGFDAVAYFTQGRAVPGKPEIALRWRGLRWHFASKAHRAAFEADPRGFAPQFGGYCAVAISEGALRPADPQFFVIHDGRLYLAETDSARGLLTTATAAVLHDAWQHARTAR